MRLEGGVFMWMVLGIVREIDRVEGWVNKGCGGRDEGWRFMDFGYVGYFVFGVLVLISIWFEKRGL